MRRIVRSLYDGHFAAHPEPSRAVTSVGFGVWTRQGAIKNPRKAPGIAQNEGRRSRTLNLLIRSRRLVLPAVAPNVIEGRGLRTMVRATARRAYAGLLARTHAVPHAHAPIGGGA